MRREPVVDEARDRCNGGRIGQRARRRLMTPPGAEQLFVPERPEDRSAMMREIAEHGVTPRKAVLARRAVAPEPMADRIRRRERPAGFGLTADCERGGGRKTRRRAAHERIAQRILPWLHRIPWCERRCRNRPRDGRTYEPNATAA